MKIHEPPMTFKSADAASEWDAGLAKNDDDYGRAVYVYASEWATLMEREIPEKGSLSDLKPERIRALCHDADDEGITGFMYGCAMAMLAAWWVHGEELRQWHNLDTQIGTEGEAANASGGVLNPALLNIETT